MTRRVRAVVSRPHSVYAALACRIAAIELNFIALAATGLGGAKDGGKRSSATAVGLAKGSAAKRATTKVGLSSLPRADDKDAAVRSTISTSILSAAVAAPRLTERPRP